MKRSLSGPPSAANCSAVICIAPWSGLRHTPARSWIGRGCCSGEYTQIAAIKISARFVIACQIQANSCHGTSSGVFVYLLASLKEDRQVRKRCSVSTGRSSRADCPLVADSGDHSAMAVDRRADCLRRLVRPVPGSARSRLGVRPGACCPRGSSRQRRAWQRRGEASHGTPRLPWSGPGKPISVSSPPAGTSLELTPEPGQVLDLRGVGLAADPPHNPLVIGRADGDVCVVGPTVIGNASRDASWSEMKRNHDSDGVLFARALGPLPLRARGSRTSRMPSARPRPRRRQGRCSSPCAASTPAMSVMILSRTTRPSPGRSATRWSTAPTSSSRHGRVKGSRENSRRRP